MKNWIFIYLVVLFLPSGLAPLPMGPFKVQPIDIFLYGGMILATWQTLRQKQNLWHGHFWDIALIWIFVSVLISLIKSFDVLGPAGGQKVLVYSVRFLTFCVASYLITFLMKQTGLEKTLKFLFWLTVLFIATGFLERFLMAMGLPVAFGKLLSLLGFLARDCSD
jgi:hypothetical protein